MEDIIELYCLWFFQIYVFQSDNDKQVGLEWLSEETSEIVLGSILHQQSIGCRVGGWRLVVGESVDGKVEDWWLLRKIRKRQIQRKFVT